MTKVKDSLRYLFYFLTGCMYLGIVADVVINPKLSFFHTKIALLLPMIAGVAAVVMVAVFVCKKIKNKKLLLISLSAILVLLQAVTIRYLAVNYTVESWDMGVVYNAAQYFVENNSFDMGKYDYFLWFPNNSPLYNIFVIIFKVFSAVGIKNTQLALNVFNAALLFFSAWLTEKSSQLLAGEEYTGVGLMLCVALCPFSLYAVLAYTDTFSMIFLALALYFYIRKMKNKGNYWVNLRAFSLFIAVGASMKVSVLVIAIAAIIDLFIGKEDVAKRAISLVLVMVISIGGFSALKNMHENSPFLPEYDYNYTIPYTHWVMMGLNGLGGYCDDDYQLITLQHPDKQSRQAANIDEIINRIEEKGAVGMVHHVANKLSFIYGDGTFTASQKLDRAAVKGSALHNYIIYVADGYKYLGYSSLAYFMAILMFISIGMFIAIKRKNTSLVMLALSLVGVTCFLILWEARTRYILNFLPVFVVLAVFGIKSIFSLMKKEENS